MKSHELVKGLNIDTTNQGTFVTSNISATPENEPGERCFMNGPGGRREYVYLKVEETFAIGQVAMISALLDNADVDAAAAIGDTRIKATGDFTASEFGNGANAAFPDAYISIDVNTGAGQTRHIKSNRGSTDYATVDKPLTVALDTTSDYVTYSINYVSLSDTDDVSARASKPKGVAISAVTDEYWAWFQTKGVCPLVRCVGTTDPAIRGALLTASSTAGAVKGPTAGGTTADDVASSIGTALHAYAAGDSAGVGVAAELDIR